MTAEVLAGLAGIVFSFLFSYIPKFNVAFEKLEPVYKRIIMGGIIVAIAAATLGLSCTSWAKAWGITTTCDQRGAQEMLTLVFFALVGNQSAFSISEKTKAVKEVDAEKQ